MKRSHVPQPRSSTVSAAIGISLIAILISIPSAASAGSRHAEGSEHRTNDDRLGRHGRSSDLTGILFPNGIQTLYGSGNNLLNPDWGQANQIYSRGAGVSYANGVASMVDGPSPRFVSNRVFNDISQNLFSENELTQWAFAWGQFLDHNFGLRQNEDDDQPIAFDPTDPAEQFTSDLGAIAFTRSVVAPGSGVNTPRQQVNTVSSYIDAWAVYGGTIDRLQWLRV